MRQFAMFVMAAGPLDHPFIAQARTQRNFPFKKTTSWYNDLLQLLCHVCPCQHTENKRTTVYLNHNLLFLTLYCVVFPKCFTAQINAFLFCINYGGPFFHYFTNSLIICVAKQQIGMTRKCGGTTVFQMCLSINQQKQEI